MADTDQQSMIFPGGSEAIAAATALSKQFAETREKYVHFCDSMRVLIARLCESAGVQVTIESRAKEVSHLQDKLQRKQHYADLSDIPDLVGIRIIVKYQSDVKTVGDLISKEFTVIESSQHEFRSPEAFGYRSHHLVVQLDRARSNLREWKESRGLKCEIQIRTILQHAWASISHSLDYKAESDVPAVLRRDLFKIAALLESADDSFERYRTDVEQLRQRYIDEENWQTLPIDAISLQSHWRKLPLEALIEACKRSNLKTDPSPPDRIPDVAVSATVRGCAILRLLTLGQIVKFIEASDADKAFKWFYETMSDAMKETDILHPGVTLLILTLGPNGIPPEDRDYVLGIHREGADKPMSESV
ncbi:GTP pyrophosphokinase family protein [Micromonospora sp. NBC_01638]|uniref:GTP pyrophosphokinase n=1 Tax=Micromonospora sp. NBC_01638 TaxID=2975982 RepID=UPI0038704A4A|nr:RelA/SpoT domain-containing protein [Micromonospora sp. NBC_01638]